MKLKTITLVTILFSSLLSINCLSQTLTPTELETAKLGKLKSDLATYQAQLSAIDTQKSLLDLQKQVLQQQGQQKYSEFLGLAESVKQAHAKDKTWDSADKITFNPQSGEAGQFTLNPAEKPKEEAKDKNAKQESSKEKDEKGQKVIPRKEDKK